MNRKTEIVLTDFSGVYRQEEFWKGREVSWVDFSSLSGTNCYCDGEAAEEIRKGIAPFSCGGIHFLDSGNYHYMSRFWMEKIQEPFRLLVFDNHTDMQLPAFGGLLSCGGWIAAALDELPMLSEVILVGPDEAAFAQTEQRYRKRVRLVSREKLKKLRESGEALNVEFIPGYPAAEKSPEYPAAEISPGYPSAEISREYPMAEVPPEYPAAEKSPEYPTAELPREYPSAEPFRQFPANLPVYVSVDKDVCAKPWADTSWSQGDMSLDELLCCLNTVISRLQAKNCRLLGVDVCGELDGAKGGGNTGNDIANAGLLSLLCERAEPLC